VGEKARVIGAAVGALGLGGMAAALGLCCTVPWAVVLLGVTGAVAFARLAFLLPYALIGAALLLGVSFWCYTTRTCITTGIRADRSDERCLKPWD
jgi:hypothetical protein